MSLIRIGLRKNNLTFAEKLHSSTQCTQNTFDSVSKKTVG